MTSNSFERTGDIATGTLAGLRGAGHGALADLLEVTGTGFVDDGFLRVIDPGTLSPHLDSLFEDPTGAVPFATTALGDIVLARGSSVDLAQLRSGQVLPFRPDPAAFLRAGESLAFRLVHLDAISFMGLARPALDRAYFATPWEAFGGSGAAETLKEADLLTTWLAASRVVGRASLP